MFAAATAAVAWRDLVRGSRHPLRRRRTPASWLGRDVGRLPRAEESINLSSACATAFRTLDLLPRVGRYESASLIPDGGHKVPSERGRRRGRAD